MYRTILLISIFFSISIISKGQQSFNDIDTIVSKSLNRYPKESKNYIIGNIIITNFIRSKKLENSLISKINVGICVGLNNNEMENIIYPARFYGTKNGLSIEAMRERYSDGLTDDMQEYVYQYLYNLKNVGSTVTFKQMISNQPKSLTVPFSNADENIILDDEVLSFIRADKDWVYVISIGKNYKKQTYPSILTYAFKVNPSGKDIFKTQNTKNAIEEKISAQYKKKLIAKQNFMFAHEENAYYIKLAVENIIKHEPFNTDKKLITLNIKLKDKEIKNYNLGNFEADFKYLAQLNLPNEFLIKNFNRNDYNFVYNIKHYANHNLGDYYLSIDNNPLAIQYLNTSLNSTPIIFSSGRFDTEDIIKINKNLSIVYQKLNDYDASFTCLLANLLMDDYIEDETYPTPLANMLIKAKQSKLNFKADLNIALKTITKVNQFEYTFNFRGLKTKFYTRNSQSIESIVNKLRESEFYKSLN